MLYFFCNRTTDNTVNAVGEYSVDCGSESYIINVTTPFSYTVLDEGISITGYLGTLTDIIIPEEIEGINVVDIKSVAFRGGQYTSITLPETLLSIGYAAFSDNNISNLIIPDSVVNIDHSAFRNNSINTLQLGENLDFLGYAAFHNNSIENIIIPSSVLSVGASCFALNNIKSVEIEGLSDRFDSYWNFIGLPEELGPELYITEDGFKFHVVSQTIVGYVGEETELSIPYYVNEIEVLNIGKGAFVGANLLNVVIPDSVLVIGEAAFAGNRNLNNVVIGSSTTIIENEAFLYTDLIELVIPDSVISIGDSSFYGNINLDTLTLSSSLVTIGSKAFYDCNINDLIIPASLENISKDTFAGNNLVNVVIEGDQDRFSDIFELY